MPIPGVSLIGFMPPQQAIAYMRESCVPANDTDPALQAEWQQAHANLGPAPTNAGQPSVSGIPASQANYVQQLTSGPWAQVFQQNPQWEFKMVEVAPLLAYQFSVLTQKSADHCAGLTAGAPTLDELLALCLPQVPPQPSAHMSRTAQSIMIQSRDLNLRCINAGLVTNNIMGLHFTFALPFAHVVRFNGRHYLINGFHRAYGAALAGATAIPCVFREVASHPEAGIRDDGSTFPLSLLESSKPPTLHHFIAGQGHPVQLKPMNRVLHVTWSEYLVPDEEF